MAVSDMVRSCIPTSVVLKLPARWAVAAAVEDVLCEPSSCLLVTCPDDVTVDCFEDYEIDANNAIAEFNCTGLGTGGEEEFSQTINFTNPNLSLLEQTSLTLLVFPQVILSLQKLQFEDLETLMEQELISKGGIL